MNLIKSLIFIIVLTIQYKLNINYIELVFVLNCTVRMSIQNLFLRIFLDNVIENVTIV